jgi:hypothetical protein
MRELFSIFLLPFWVFFIAAFGVGYLTFHMIADERETLAEVVIALEQPVPAPVDLSVFDKKADKGLADEVHVQGWFNTDYSTRLIKKKNGVTTSKRVLMVLFGTSDTDEATEVKAAMVLTEAEHDRFVDEQMDYVSDYGRFAPIFQFNGRARPSASHSGLAHKAMKRDGLTLSPNFFFIDPYWDGREAGLTDRGADVATMQVMGYGFAAFLLLIGFIKLQRRRSRKAKQKQFDSSFDHDPIISTSGPKPARQAVPAASAPVSAGLAKPSRVFATDSPLGRLTAQTAEPIEAEAAAPVKLKAKTFGWPQQGMLPTLVKGVVGLVALAYVLPTNAVGFVIPILMIGCLLYGMKKLSEAVQSGLAGLFFELWPSRGAVGSRRTTGSKQSDDIFSRLH